MKVFLDTVGCRLNQAEIENYARQFRAAGHTLVSEVQDADLMALNSCSVTASAASDSRQKIRQAEHAGVSEIVVTGCMATLMPEATLQMSGVTQVIPNLEKDQLVSNLLDIEINEFDLEPIARQPIPGSRMRTRAFIKVQDGCDNVCTFCVTTLARGKGRSRSVKEIVSDIQAAANGGALEVVLTGVHLGSWGYDLPQSSHLRELITNILDLTDIPRVRVSSLEPWDLDDEFFDLWQNPRLCRHLHLPLQSGSAATLRRMARKTTPESFAALVNAARARIPDVAITTDIIAGFPGESEAEFEETRQFVDQIGFAGAHVFTYSAREGTAAAKMPKQVHNATRKERNAAIREIIAESGLGYRNQFLGQQVDVLWESVTPASEGRWEISGLTDNYLRVTASAPQPIWNQIVPAQLTHTNEAGFTGEILSLPDTIILGGAHA